MSRMRRLSAWLLLPLLMMAAAAQAAFTFTRVSSATFYTDTSVTPNLVCNYQGFAITSTTAVADAWAQMSNFGGGFLSLGGGDDVQPVASSFAQRWTGHMLACQAALSRSSGIAGVAYKNQRMTISGVRSSAASSSNSPGA